MTNGEGGGREKKGWRQQVLPGFLVLAMAITFFFVLDRFDDLCGKIGSMVSVLLPFIYGGVMAYMLRMPCNFF